jgi:hypothetical protein
MPQPPLASSRPQMVYPKEIYDLIIATPDADVLANMSETEPPVKITS